MTERFLLVMLGAGAGALLRFLLLAILPEQRPYLTAIYMVNLIGSFILGALSVLQLGAHLVLLLQTGVLGGFTTFSSMMTESAQQENKKKQFTYLTLQIFSGFVVFLLSRFVVLFIVSNF